MARLVVVSLTVLLASAAVAYADPGDGQDRRGQGRHGDGEARSEWRGGMRGRDQPVRPPREDGFRDSGPRDTSQRPNGGLYVPRSIAPPSVAPAAPTPPPAAIANNGGPPAARGYDGPRRGEGSRDRQGWRGSPNADQGDRRGFGDPAPRPQDYGANRGDERTRGGGTGYAPDTSRGREGYARYDGRDGSRGRDQGDVRRYGDGGRDNRDSDRWTERGHDRAAWDNRGGDRRYDSGHGYRGRPGEGHDFRDRDRGRSWYNPQYFHQHYRATYRYRAPPYRYPHGWFERTWYYGDYLPGGWYSASYYLDWRAYGLGYPPIGCEWIRVGRDALLVDIWSGEVLSVYYDLFW